MKRDTAAIIVAGGQGKRFGGKVRKQFLSLAGQPLLAWSVAAFAHSPSIGVIIVVVPSAVLLSNRLQFLRWKFRAPILCVAGGKTRADSVREGLAAIPSEFRWVAVHDGVRPLVTPALIEEVLAAARGHRAAIAATPSKDSVKLATAHGTIQKSLPRQSVWLAQTPQAFERTLIERAHGLQAPGSRLKGKKSPGADITDDSMLVERLGVRVKLIDGTQDNLKITVPSDLHLAERLLRGRR